MIDFEQVGRASLDELKRGYVETDEHCTCLLCGETFEKGIIYPADGVLYEAGRYTRLHIEREHGSVFEHLVSLDRSLTGLSTLQKRLLLLFYAGKSDAEVQKELGTGSSSTIRNHRFLLRERERQAKLFQAIMELLRARESALPGGGSSLAASRKGGTVDRSEALIAKHFPHGAEGPLRSLSIPAKQRRTVFGKIAERFQSGRTYTEVEINQVLESAFPDYVTLRRYLVDYGLLQRLPDGSQYWRSDSAHGGQPDVEHKKELKRLARETKTEAGVYAVRNTRNGKLLVDSTRNLKTINGKRFQLETGSHQNKALQQDWNDFGPEAFTFEVLELLEVPETGYFDEADALQKLKAAWLERLQPFGERGYNTTREQK